MRPRIKAVITDNGLIKQLQTKGEVEVEITDEDGTVVARYSTSRSDITVHDDFIGAPI